VADLAEGHTIDQVSLEFRDTRRSFTTAEASAMPTLNNVTNRTFDDIQVGDSAEMSRILSQTDIEVLALVSGDVDPFYVSGNGAAGQRASARTTEAAGAEALVAAVLGTQLPGPGMRIVRQDLRFRGRMSVGDQLTAKVTAKEKQTEGREVAFACRCVNQVGEELVTGKVIVAAPADHVMYAEVTPPVMALRHGDAFARLYKACEGLPPVPCAVAHPCDRDSLLGPIEAARRGLIIPILVGPEEKIRAVAKVASVDLGPYRIVPVPHSHAAADMAVELVRNGEAEALMKGSLHTDELMGAVVPSAAGMRTARRISHVFVMDVPSYPRMLLITDAAINITPGLEEKVDILQNAIDLAHILGIEQPKAAILAAVETVTSRMPSTLDAAALCKMADRDQITGGIVDGPLAFDNAISEEAARAKKIVSPVAGQADILLVPDLEAGNILAKQLSYMAGAEGAGIVLGARVPIVLTSRADSVRTRLASTAVMALAAHARRTKSSLR
jgi:phosphotransacetylase/acyl dehydratase